MCIMNVDLDNQSISSCLSCFAHSWFCNVVILLCNLQFFSVVSYFTIHCKERQSNDPNIGNNHSKLHIGDLQTKVKNCYEIFADFALMICKQKGKKFEKLQKDNSQTVMKSLLPLALGTSLAPAWHQLGTPEVVTILHNSELGKCIHFSCCTVWCMNMKMQNVNMSKV